MAAIVPRAHARAARATRVWCLALAFAAVHALACAQAPSAPDYESQRRAMVDQIKAVATNGTPPVGQRVFDALAKVPRHELVPEELRGRAYEDTPLPIGNGQTISQPYVVAVMTQLADVSPAEKVLEIGTGSGYQAAVLAEMGASVYTIEIVEALGREAEGRLQKLGYGDRVHVRIGDGFRGWTEHAPYDAIVVTAAPEHIPPPLLMQLAPGGVLVIPLGAQNTGQQLTVIEKSLDGSISKREVLPVRFVPLTRDGAGKSPPPRDP